MPFTEFPIPTVLVPNLGGQGSIFFPQTGNFESHNIFCDNFFKVGETLGDCRWEYWYRPELLDGATYGGGYVIVGSELGTHEILSGLNVAADWSTVTGNFFVDVSNPNSYTAPDEFRTGEFVHVSVGLRGMNVYIHVFGVLSNIVPLTAARQSFGSKLFLSGSDHNGAAGYLFGARGYEGSGVMDDYRKNFVPDHHFVPRKLSFDLTEYEVAKFCMMTDHPTGAFIDTSEGYETVTGAGAVQHHGFLNIGKDKPPRSGGFFPVFAPGVVPEPPVAFRAVPATPGGALLFDSFNRTPVVPAWHSVTLPSNQHVLGTMPSGSLGPLTWQNCNGWGILGGRAFSSYQTAAHPWVTTDRTNIRLSVKRINNSVCKTGLTARYVDDNNVVYAIGSPTGISIFNRTGGVSTQNDFAISGWEKLDLQVNGTVGTVYADDVSLGTLTVTANSSVKHGLFANTQLDDIFRFDDFTAVAAA